MSSPLFATRLRASAGRLNNLRRWYVLHTLAFVLFSLAATSVGLRAQDVSTFASGFTGPSSLVFDTAGNLYTVNWSSTTASKVTPEGVRSDVVWGLFYPSSVAFDTAGNLYIANSVFNTVSKTTPGGVTSTFASGFSKPMGLAFDTEGNLYVSNNLPGTISKVTPGGVVSPFASGFNSPVGLALDPAGNLYVANFGNGANTVSKVTPEGVVSTFASGSGLNRPYALAFDTAGNLYGANYYGNSVSKITPGGVVSTFVSGVPQPSGLAFDAAGYLYVANYLLGTISKVTPTAPTVTTPTSASIAGTTATLGGNATSDGGVAITARGVVYSVTATNSNPQLAGTGVTNVAGTGTTGVFTVSATGLTAGTGYSYAAYATNSRGTTYSSVGTFTMLSADATLSALALSAGTLAPTFASGTTSYTASVAGGTTSLTVTPTVTQANATTTVNGTSVASAAASGAISLNVGANTITTIVTAQDGTTTKTYTVTVTRAAATPTVTTPTSASIAAKTATLGGDVTSDGGGTITARGVVYAVTATNSYPQIGGTGVTNVAGTGTTGAFTLSVFNLTAGAGYSYAAYATNSAGTTYSPVGTFTTLSTDAANIFVTGLTYPAGLACDSADNLYVINSDIDTNTNTVMKVTPEGIVTTFVASDAGLSSLKGMAFDSANNLYLANEDANTVIKVTPGGVVTTFVASGAGLSGPVGLAFDSSGDFYVANSNANTVSRVTPAGVVTTSVASDAGLSGPSYLACDSLDNRYVNGWSAVSKITPGGSVTTFLASGFPMTSPSWMAVDPTGNLFVSNSNAPYSVCKITPEGFATTFSRDFSQPTGLAFDSAGNLYVADSMAGTVIKFTFPPTVTTPTSASVAATTATLGGNVTYRGSAAITARGVVYSLTATNPNPQLSGTGVTSATSAGTTGVFTVNVTGLTAGTTYSYAAYATNSAGTTYSSVGTFTTITLSTDATLSALTLNTGTLAPVFVSGTTSYTASVASGTTSLTVTPTAAQANATITVNGTTVASGAASGAISLNVGANTITTIVTAQDGTTTKTYTLTVTRAAASPTISWSNPAAITYGTALSATQLNATSGGVDGTFTYTPALGAVLGAGDGQTLRVDFTPTDTSNYHAVLGTTVPINVNKAPLTVTANAASRAYFASDPTFTATITGFVNGDTVSAVSGAPSFTTNATATSAAGGRYAITPALGGLTATNYAFTTFEAGVFTIGTKAITVTATAGQSKIYGATDPALAYTITSGGPLVTGDAFSGELTRATGETVGTTYAIAQGTLTAGNNYAVTFVPANFAITKKSLTVTADNQSRPFQSANPTLTYTVTGFAFTDIAATALTGSAALTTTADTTSAPGPYPITAALGTLAATNYALTLADGTLTVANANATVTLGSLAQTYNGTPRAATATTTPTGLAVALLYGTPSSATAPTDAGTYPVSASVTSTGYTATASGSLVISPATQTVTFAPVGTTNPGGTYTLSAISSAALPVTFSVVSGPASVSGATLTVNGSGAIVLRATQTGTANYLAASADQTLSASKVNQSITFAQPPDKLATDGPFALTASSSSGLPVTLTLISGPAFLSGSTVTLTGAAGTVLVRASQAGNNSYRAAPDVTRSFAVTADADRVFFGDFFSSEAVAKNPLARSATAVQQVGDIAAVLPAHSNTGTLMIVAPTAGINVLIAFTLQLDGTFVTTSTQIVNGASRPITLRGQLAASVLAGSIDGLGFTFTTSVEPLTGPSVAACGFYESTGLATAAATTYTIIGSNNNVLVLTFTPTLTVGGLATLQSDNCFQFDLPAVGSTPAVTVKGAVDTPTTTVSGTLLVAQQPPVDLAGLKTTTSRTDRLINLSSRAKVGPGEKLLITGLVIGGTTPKPVLVRAVGPGLTHLGVNGVLTNPKIRIETYGRIVAENDDWGQAADPAAITSATNRIGAFPLAASSADAALLTTLQPGVYTVQVTASGTTTQDGVALAEIYDASENPAADYQRLVNISSRGEVTSGENVLIGGFIITGNSPKRVLIRGVGPGLSALSVSNPLADPLLKIYQGNTLLASNDNWSTDATAAAELTTATASLGAFALKPGSKDAAIILNLAPGYYTAHVLSATAGSGIALIEIYEIPE